MKPLIISFFSDIENNNYYSDHGKRLIDECEALGLRYDIAEKESIGDYRLNCLSKPQYILDKLDEKQEDLLWLDVDSKLHSEPVEFNDMNSDIGFTTSNGNLSGMKASPIFLKNNENSRMFIKTWIKSTSNLLENDISKFDHEPLFQLIPMFLQSNTISMSFVGEEYCAWPGNTNNNTVITMGLADAESKKEKLRSLGMSEDKIEWQSPGNKHEQSESNRSRI
jgi:hypothetical protein